MFTRIMKYTYMCVFMHVCVHAHVCRCVCNYSCIYLCMCDIFLWICVGALQMVKIDIWIGPPVAVFFYVVFESWSPTEMGASAFCQPRWLIGTWFASPCTPHTISAWFRVMGTVSSYYINVMTQTLFFMLLSHEPCKLSHLLSQKSLRVKL